MSHAWTCHDWAWGLGVVLLPVGSVMLGLTFAMLRPVGPGSPGLERPIAESRFDGQIPAGWTLGKGWSISAAGAVAEGTCEATWDFELPDQCMVEMLLDLPSTDRLGQGVAASLSVGRPEDPDGAITASAQYGKLDYSASISGPGSEGRRVSASVKRDTRPSVLLDWEQAAEHAGWAKRTVSLGLWLDPHASRLLVNGCQVAETAAGTGAGRRVSVEAAGVTVRAVRVLPGVPRRWSFLTGAGLAMLSGGESTAMAAGLNARPMESVVIEVNGVPLIIQGAGEEGVAALSVEAERWKSQAWSEGSGMLKAPVLPARYSAAHLLVYCPAASNDRTPAMGFGLRVPEMSAADLRNVYVGQVPVRSSDAGVTVQPMPELGEGWFLARVPLNPGAQNAEGFHAYFSRPWGAGGGIPQPSGKPSALRVAAVTLEAATIALSVQGNGLGNVYCEPDRPALVGTVRNMADEPVSVELTAELIPLERPPAARRWKLQLGAGQEMTFDALAVPVAERGHYRVRVIADGGAAGLIDYRSNLALLAPDTRQKVGSPFGCWSRLWDDRSTPQQSDYLKEKAGVGFVMGKHHFDYRMDMPVPDDAAADEIVGKAGPDVRIFMLGWEQTWSMEQTFAFPRVITEGKPEELPQEIAKKVDETAAQFRRVAAAVRRLRPDAKISLGNSAVNFSVPLLERGFKPGVEFDYFGTEEGIFWSSPEQPTTAIGNVNWWARAVCEHFGFKNVPIFHSETVYFSTGPAFSRMPERTQAGHYVRTYLLGFPYDSIFGFSGAMVDSSNQYIYSLWGASGYCNQAPECSPKLSYVAFATLTQLLDGARYAGKLYTGTTSVYALRFTEPDGTPLTVLWNLRGSRRVTAQLSAAGEPQVLDVVNRPVEARRAGTLVPLTISELPLYVRGVDIAALRPGENVPDMLLPCTLLSPLENLATWPADAEPDTAFEKPREWMGMPKVKGSFTVAYRSGLVPPGTAAKGAVAFRQEPLPGKHGLIPRYVSMTASPEAEIPIPAGTTELGLWVYGNSTWAQVKLGLRTESGTRWLVLDDDLYGRMTDNFDSWRFLRTGELGEDVQQGSCKLCRIVVTMPQQQVYVDDLLTTANPEIAVWGLYAITEPPAPVSYLPW